MINNLLIFFTLPYFFALSSCEEDAHKALAIAINSSEMSVFLSHYTGNKSIIYVKQSSQPTCNGENVSLGKLKTSYKESIIMYSSEPLAPGEKVQAAKQNYFNLPKGRAVIIIDYFTIRSTHADIKLRIPIEGVHASFTLTKNPTWSITDSDVYEQ
ncbi:hypothetical protein HNQ93_003458 [Hymenobacter luteus]|uniref:Uncharacterized protein n=2 Tax=Hymenobacter TaxID=89966 RepID=A0A7W9T4D7_9BACT|nr:MULTISPECIES: hypothetical protein [Hymenobacter]MBB4602693.1 hypothetical protein [Hymenobacter latericoloratus]MBB6060584.1 hypothetical protein [Hymenobacter luteus]